MDYLQYRLNDFFDLMYTTINETSEITSPEIYRYLEDFTQWDEDKIYLLIDEINNYLDHGFMELKLQECIKIYNDQKWEIPTNIVNKEQEMDICKMLERTEFYQRNSDSLYIYAKELLEKELNALETFPIENLNKGGRPKAEYEPIETLIVENPTYKTPKEIADFLKNQYYGKKAIFYKTMIKALENLNIYKTNDIKKTHLMLQKDFGLSTGFENYRKAEPQKNEIDKLKASIQKIITKTK